MKGEEKKPGEAQHESRATSHESRVSLIVAMANNRVIGTGNKIPWHLPGELKMFKTITMGHHIVMGRRTYESINRLLPGRTTVIVTRQSGYRVSGAIIAHGLEDAIAACHADDEIFVIGGGELFQSALPIADRIYLTTVDAEPAGDTLMPEFDLGKWRETSSQSYPADNEHRHAYRFAVYDRIAT